MTNPQNEPVLEPSDSDEAALEADLGTVTDDEFFDALAQLPPFLTDAATGEPIDPREGVVDDRNHR